MNNLRLQSSPHIHSPVSASRLMINMLIALAPVTIFGIVNQGAKALALILVCVAAAMAAETLFRFIIKRPSRARDASAAVTGLLLALVCPPTLPLWMAALGAVFAVVVVKEFFGGLGANVFNPALAGRAFLLMSFPAAMTSWITPTGWQNADVVTVTTATPLGLLKEMSGAPAYVSGASMHFGTTAASTVEKAAGYSGYGDMLSHLFFGDYAGSLGETSAFLILCGAFFLLITKTIDWRAPLTMIGASVVMSFILGEDPLFTVLTGGLLFGAVFMATDYTTAPITPAGKLIFGAGCGVITMLIRRFGNYPEGVMYSILIMNITVPFLNRIIHHKYGWVKPVKAAQAKGASK
jgi:electron transport complex protein RnfD